MQNEKEEDIWDQIDRFLYEGNKLHATIRFVRGGLGSISDAAYTLEERESILQQRHPERFRPREETGEIIASIEENKDREN